MRQLSRRSFLRQCAAGLLFTPFVRLPVRPRAPESDAELIARLTKIVPALLSDNQVPGLQIALIRDAKVIWSQGYGTRSVTGKEPVNTETVFEAASLSKPAFAYVALKLCESGKLSLDAPLTQYLPEPFIPDEPRLKLITARMVLSHSSGLSHVRPPGAPLTINFTPGTDYSYSAPGFQYLQIVIERLTGRGLAELMYDYLLKPLSMSNSSFGWQERFEKNFAQGNDRNGRPGLSGNGRYRQFTEEQRLKFNRDYPENRVPSAAAGLYTTAADFAKFMIEIMRPSRKDETHLSEQAINEMLRPQVKVQKAMSIGQPVKGVSWGLGWGIEETVEGDAFWHWGDWGVYRNFALGHRKQKAGLVILTNSFNGARVYMEVIKEATGGTHPAFDFLLYQKMGF